MPQFYLWDFILCIINTFIQNLLRVSDLPTCKVYDLKLCRTIRKLVLGFGEVRKSLLSTEFLLEHLVQDHVAENDKNLSINL